MRIKQYQNNSATPNFTSFNVVQVSKEAPEFIGLKNLIEIEDTFRGKVSEIFEMGKNINEEPFSLLEQPFYSEIVGEFNKMKQDGAISEDCGLDWLFANAGVSIRQSQNPLAYSFLMYTKNDEKAVLRNFKGIKPFQIAIKAFKHVYGIIQRGKASFQHMDLIHKMKMSEIIMANIEQVTSRKPIRTFELDDLSKLSDALEQIEKLDNVG